jgi:hypothetical protein
VSYLGCYDANSNLLIWDNSDDLYSPNAIFDIAVNNLYPYYYLARTSTFEAVQSDIDSYHAVCTINSFSPHKELLYIQTEELHGIYCSTQEETPIANIYWIDGNNNTTRTFLAPINILHGMAYNPDNHELYFGGGARIYYCNGINPQGFNSIILPLEGADVSNLECFHNTVYVSTQNNIISITGSNHNINTKLTKQNNYFGRGAYDSENDNVVITNMEGASLEIFKAQGGYSNLLTGVSVYKSCYNPDNGKFYFYSDELRDDSKIVIIKRDLTGYTYNPDKIIGYELNGSEVNISSCCYNESANDLLISSYSETYQISKRNGSDNLDDGTLTLTNEFCENVFISPQPDNKIYCATAMNSLSDASIEIFDAESYSTEGIVDELGSGYESYEFRTEFCYNTIDNDVYFLLFRRNGPGTFGKLIRIDPDNGYSKESFDLPGNPDKLVYSEGCNKIYIKYDQEEFITEFDCNGQSMSNYNIYGNIVKDIDYSNFFDKLYVLTAGDNHLDHIYAGVCSDFAEPLGMGNVPASSISFLFNELNQRVYTFSPWEYDVEYESHLSILDHEEANIDDLYLHNSQCKRIINPASYNDLTEDPVNGYLLVPNGSHSNISVIRCLERFELTKKINWISFPRLDRDPQSDEGINSVEALTHRIKPGQWFTYTGHMYYHDYELGMTSVDKATYTSPWIIPSQYGLDNVYSNRGYQLYLEPDKKSLYFYGQIQDPAVPVELEGTETNRFHNWVGYYLTYPQSPFDAIPENILDNLTIISGQYWSCTKHDPAPIESGSDCWRCAVNQGRVEIKYGDMVRLTSAAKTTFNWQQNNSNEPSIEKLKAESFTYTEQYDYNAIFIELDTNDMPSEIGAYAGDSCVGATKVIPGDTIVLICAYTEGYESEDITFGFSYATKAARIDKPDYFEFNQSTGKSERRMIKAGENQSYHFVSFKLKDDIQLNTVSTVVNCYPNPASGSFNVSYYLSEDACVKLELLSPLGIVVYEKQLGYQTEGNHACDIQSIGIPVGYYFVRIYTADQSYTGTLLINH